MNIDEVIIQIRNSIYSDLEKRITRELQSIKKSLNEIINTSDADIEEEINRIIKDFDWSEMEIINHCETSIIDTTVEVKHATRDFIENLNDMSNDTLKNEIDEDVSIYEYIINPDKEIIDYYKFTTML